MKRTPEFIQNFHYTRDAEIGRERSSTSADIFLARSLVRLCARVCLFACLFFLLAFPDSLDFDRDSTQIGKQPPADYDQTH